MAEGDPSQEELLWLHGAWLADDGTAPAKLADVLKPALQQRFANRQDLDQHEIESLIGNSIARYLHNPERYDPDRAPLLAYLYQDVDGDIRNEIAKRSRRPEAPLDDESVDIRASRGNPTLEDVVLDRLDPLDLPRKTVDAALQEVEALSEEDREFLRLRAEGVRATHAYAEVLGVAHLPKEQRRRAVKRAKDRLDKRLEKIRERLGR